MVVPKPMLTEFGIHYGFESCVEHKLTKSVVSIRSVTDSKLRHGVHSLSKSSPNGDSNGMLRSEKHSAQTLSGNHPVYVLCITQVRTQV